MLKEAANLTQAGRNRFLRASHGFSLMELLVVMAIMSMLVAFSGPLVSTLAGANSVDKAVTDLSRTLEQARVYAMAHNTYVRVGFGTVAKSSTRPAPLFVVYSIYAADGTLDKPGAADMTSNVTWPAVNRPLILNNFNPDTALGTASDITPDTTDVPPFSRKVGDIGTVNFSGCIQFSPSGTARVQLSTYPRFIKVALDRPVPMNGKNPFVIRLTALTGSIEILRKENL